MDMGKRGGHEDVNEQDHDLEGSAVTRYPYLSVLLKEHGYEAVHINGALASFADTEHYYRFSGQYDDFIAVAQNEYADQRQYDMGYWGARDIDTFSVASDWLEAREREPFFLTISTTDLHHPYSHALEKAGIDNDLLNCVYSTDVGFGEFWNYFQNSKYKSNTILIVTADHALFPTTEYLNIRGGGYWLLR